MIFRADPADLAAQQAFSQLAAAVARVTYDMRRRQDDAGVSVEDTVESVRTVLDYEGVLALAMDGKIPTDLAAAYMTVIDAGDAAATPAVTSHADGILTGDFGSSWWEPTDEDPDHVEAEGPPADEDLDDLPPEDLGDLPPEGLGGCSCGSGAHWGSCGCSPADREPAESDAVRAAREAERRAADEADAAVACARAAQAAEREHDEQLARAAGDDEDDDSDLAPCDQDGGF